jgi:hypothetical protein
VLVGDADLNGDEQVSVLELNAYISQWFSGSHSIGGVVRAMREWKGGCS